ncbi:MAG: hypothetical protein GY705_16960, partial [Bacteroidetes bacterium]|nr:hypothetical protein [Bacteroidota bacterium]
MKNNVYFIPTLLLFLLFCVDIKSGWALQSHSAPEGIYVHQMAHLLFMGALGYLYWHTRKSQIFKSKGWKFLQVFCILLILWNLLAFTGHEAFEQLSPEDFASKNNLNGR